MTYAKPEIAILGTATQVIQSLDNKHTSNNDGGGMNNNPAYDLDE